jgi:hypothetical protein
MNRRASRGPWKAPAGEDRRALLAVDGLKSSQSPASVTDYRTLTVPCGNSFMNKNCAGGRHVNVMAVSRVAGGPRPPLDPEGTGADPFELVASCVQVGRVIFPLASGPRPPVHRDGLEYSRANLPNRCTRCALIVQRTPLCDAFMHRWNRYHPPPEGRRDRAGIETINLRCEGLHAKRPVDLSRFQTLKGSQATGPTTHATHRRYQLVDAVSQPRSEP